MNDKQLREIALSKAVAISGPRALKGPVLEIAEAFYEFLKGDTQDEANKLKKDLAAPSLD